MKKLIGDQTEQSKEYICRVYWINILINVAIVVVFLIFSMSNVGDAPECYISNENPNVAT